MAERGWNIEIKGLRELEKILVNDLPNTASRQVLLATIKKSAKPMMASAKAKVPKGGSGALAESIGLKTIRNRGNNKDFASVALSPMNGNATAWAMYKAHYSGLKAASDLLSGAISATDSKKRRIRHGHLVEFGFMHKQSGKKVRKRPFLRPAFDEQSTAFTRSFRTILAAKIKNKVRAIARKNASKVRGK